MVNLTVIDKWDGSEFPCVCCRGQLLQAELNGRIFEDLLQFVRVSHANFRVNGQAGLGCGHTVVHEIPTAALVTGVYQELTQFRRITTAQCYIYISYICIP